MHKNPRFRQKLLGLTDTPFRLCQATRSRHSFKTWRNTRYLNICHSHFPLKYIIGKRKKRTDIPMFHLNAKTEIGKTSRYPIFVFWWGMEYWNNKSLFVFSSVTLIWKMEWTNDTRIENATMFSSKTWSIGSRFLSHDSWDFHQGKRSTWEVSRYLPQFWISPIMRPSDQLEAV